MLSDQERVNNSLNGKKNSKCWCVCECGNVKFILTQALKNGSTISCGCYKREKAMKEPQRASKFFIYGSYKRNAINDGFEFDLTEEKLYSIIFRNCHYCGKEPQPWSPYSRKGKNKNGYSPETINRSWINVNGIDRVNSKLGYSIDNCVSCCTECNLSKLNRTVTQFIAHAQRIVDFQKNNLTLLK